MKREKENTGQTKNREGIEKEERWKEHINGERERERWLTLKRRLEENASRFAAIMDPKYHRLRQREEKRIDLINLIEEKEELTLAIAEEEGIIAGEAPS